ncbi:MAG: HAD-IIA family hydrolase [Acidimicrobiia bacterium]|jgi:HAD superfamily hydrolase (TIGR01450 family)
MTPRLDGYGPIDTVICDIDGVILLGREAVPDSADALSRLRAAGVQIILATNNSSRRPDVVRKLVSDVVGFDAGPDGVVTSGAATAELIAGVVTRVYVVGTDGLRDTLRERGVAVTLDWREADAVVAGLDPGVTYDDLAEAGLAIQNGAVFYATNSDASFPRPDGLYPGAGALVAALVTTTGCEPVVCGKPHPPMRQAISRRGGTHRLVVGDRPETDIALGKAEGWPTVLPLTGVISDPASIPADLEPDVVVGSIAELPDVLGI